MCKLLCRTRRSNIWLLLIYHFKFRSILATVGSNRLTCIHSRKPTATLQANLIKFKEDPWLRFQRLGRFDGGFSIKNIYVIKCSSQPAYRLRILCRRGRWFGDRLMPSARWHCGRLSPGRVAESDEPRRLFRESSDTCSTPPCNVRRLISRPTGCVEKSVPVFHSYDVNISEKWFCDAFVNSLNSV